MEENLLLTTIDNPYSPFTKWDDWYNWDVRHGYDTCGLMARIYIDGRELTDADRDRLYLDAANSIINIYGNDVYKLVGPDYNFKVS